MFPPLLPASPPSSLRSSGSSGRRPRSGSATSCPLIAAGYEQRPEEDIVRLEWWGLYHDKPKIGTLHAPDQAPERALDAGSCGRSARSPSATAAATASSRRGRTSSCTGSSSARCPRSSRTSTPRALDRRRLRRHRPQHHRLPGRRARPRRALRRARRLVEEAAASSTATRTTSTSRASTRSRSPPAPTAATRRRSTASRSSARSTRAARASPCASAAASPRCRGSPATWASSSRRRRRSRSCGAILDAWKDDLRYRVSRVKARLKFMIDDIGPEGMRERVEARLGRALEDFELPPVTTAPSDHLGIHEQKQPGLVYVGVPSPRARLGRADDRRRRPRRELGGDVRVTRHQNFVVANVPDGRGRRRRLRAGRDRLPARRQPRARPLDRLHRRAALQLLRHGDEDAPRAADRALEERFGDGDRRAAPATRRLPARVRAALGRRPRLPGDDRARRGGRAPAGLRHLRARRPRRPTPRSAGRSSAASRPRSSTGGRRASSRAGSRAPRTASRSPPSATASPTTSSAPWPGLEPARKRERAETEAEEAA